MVTTQMKTDAQRLGNGKKAFNVKQVEKMMEDAGDSYTAGDGITITDDTISVDTASIQEKLTAGDGIIITENVISATGKVFTKETSNTWTKFITSGKINSDLIIILRTTQYTVGQVFAYVPKGTSIYDNITLSGLGEGIIWSVTAQLATMLDSGTAISFYLSLKKYSISDSTLSYASENIQFYKNNESQGNHVVIYY